MLQALEIQAALRFLSMSLCHRDSKSRNPQCPWEHGNPTEHRAHARKVPTPERPGTVFFGYNWHDIG